MGLEVTVIDPASVPLEHVLGVEAGAIYRDIHIDHGVKLLPDTRVESFEGAGDVQRVRTVDGRTIDVRLRGRGRGRHAQHRAGRRHGIAVENGIVTDEFLQTGVEGVFAAGDVANARHPLFGQLRVEHWANALHQGPTAARNMLGGVDPATACSITRSPMTASPTSTPTSTTSAWSTAGHATDWDEVVFRGDVERREFIAFWLKDQRILAGMNVNVWDVTDQIQSLIRSRLRVDRDRLADADTPLTELAPDLPPREARTASGCRGKGRGQARIQATTASRLPLHRRRGPTAERRRRSRMS